MSAKLTYQHVQQYFQDHNCTLLSTEYITGHKPLRYTCECGDEGLTSFFKFRSGNRCKHCRVKRRQATNLDVHGHINAGATLESQAKSRATKTAKYGDPFYSDKEKRLKTRFKNQGKQSSKSYSKQSQQLFWSVYKALPEEWQSKTYFGELNKEYNILCPKDKRIYSYDFVVSSIKRCVEFNGHKFHPRPELDDNEMGWFPFNPSLTAKDKRTYDTQKINTLMEARNIQTLVVWDYEYEGDEQGTIQAILNFLTGPNGTVSAPLRKILPTDVLSKTIMLK